MQKRRNSIANALELRFFCINPSVFDMIMQLHRSPGGCFTNVSQALQNNIAKIYNAINNIYAWLWAHVQSCSLKFS